MPSDRDRISRSRRVALVTTVSNSTPLRISLVVLGHLKPFPGHSPSMCKRIIILKLHAGLNQTDVKKNDRIDLAAKRVTLLMHHKGNSRPMWHSFLHTNEYNCNPLYRPVRRPTDENYHRNICDR